MIVDDHKIVISGVKFLLGKNENYQIVAEASNGKDALVFFRFQGGRFDCYGRQYGNNGWDNLYKRDTSTLSFEKSIGINNAR